MSKVPGGQTKVHYEPPWNNVSIIGIAGSSGSGKSTLSRAIVQALDLPWVVIVGMDSFYKPLSEEDHKKAHRNEIDFDSPKAIDFDLIVDRLKDLKHGRRAEMPIYSFVKHQREKETNSVYSPHVLVLEGILALHDPRVLELLDMKVFCEADADTCLSRRLLRDVKERGRDVEGCIKQWFAFVKPNFETYVHPQRQVADIIVPRGIENTVAITMVSQYIERKLIEKSKVHREALKKLGRECADEPLSENVIVLEQTPQVRGINTIIQDIDTSAEDFIFYFDRMAVLLVENALNGTTLLTQPISTRTSRRRYSGLSPLGEPSAVVILRAGATLETGLRRVIPSCRTGRILIQSNTRTGEPELHYQKLSPDISLHPAVLLLDPQMSSGGAALMSVQVLIDHGVAEEKIVFVTYFAGKMGLNRLTKVFPKLKVVVCEVVGDYEERWIEKRYLRC